MTNNPLSIFSSNPLRPIIHATENFNYNFTKFLVQIITPWQSVYRYTIENSFTFIKEICALKPSRIVKAVSFDIESLFRNAHLKETTYIINNMHTSSLLNYFGLNKTTYRKVLDIPAHHSLFSFSDSFYKQADVFTSYSTTRTLSVIF